MIRGVMLDELRRDLDAMLAEVLKDLTAEPEPLKAPRLACLVALPAFEVEGAHEVIVAALEARGAAELLAPLAVLHPEPLRGAAAAALERLGGTPEVPPFELRRTIRLDDEELSVMAGDLRADGAAFAVRVISDGGGLRGGLGPAASPEEVAEALDEVGGAELHPSVAAAELRSLLEEAARLGIGTDDELAVDGPLVVHALGLPPEAWPDLPLLEAEPAPGPEPEPAPAVPPRPPRDAARKKAQRKSQRQARKRNR